MKRTMTAMFALCLAAGLVLPASALEYTIDAPDGPDYGKPTSVEVVHTADGGARKNEDVSKTPLSSHPVLGRPAWIPGTPGAISRLTCPRRRSCHRGGGQWERLKCHNARKSHWLRDRPRHDRPLYPLHGGDG